MKIRPKPSVQENTAKGQLSFFGRTTPHMPFSDGLPWEEPRLDGYRPSLCCPRIPLSTSVSASPKSASVKVSRSVPSGCHQCPNSLLHTEVARPGSVGEG